MAKTQSMISTRTLFAAAVAADAINQGAYIKEGAGSWNASDCWVPDTRTPNKTLVRQLVLDPAAITEADYQAADEIIRHLRTLTFRIIGGKTLGDFEQQALAIADSEETPAYHAGVVAYYPTYYRREQAQAEARQKIFEAAAGYLGNTGDKVEVQAEVLSCFYSQQWGTYYIRSITTDNLVVRFAYKKSLLTGAAYKLRGTVTECSENTTKLSRVKVLDN